MADDRKVALVTGGARRVGAAIVRRLADDGWDVAFTFRSSQKAALALQTSLASAGAVNRILPLSADFERLEQSLTMVRERFIKWSPRLDLIVNNASVYSPDAKLSAEVAMRVNYIAPTRLIETFRTELTTANGSVVNLLDAMVERPMPSYSNYAASKAALWNATLSLARSLAPAVRVNGIAPGVVEWAENVSQADRDAYTAKVPLKRVGTPEDIAAAVRFLAVDATFITGQIIKIDGGRSLTA